MEQVLLYGKIDCAFIVKEVSGNPFDYLVKAKITKPDGKTYLLNTFFNGNNEFIARVYADIVGKYTCEFLAKNSEVVEKSIEFEAIADEKLFGKPIKCEKNPKKIKYANGNPFYMLGFEVDWLFMLDDNCTDFPKAKTLIDTIEKYGFNMVVTSLYAKDVTWHNEIAGIGTEYDFTDPNQTPFIRKGEDFDYDMLDVDYFKRVDKIMEYLMEKNIVSHFMIYVWNKLVKWPEIHSKADNRFFDYVVRRYQAYPNLIWDVSKEALLYGNVTPEDIRIKSIYLREQDVYNTLVTVHDAGFCSNNPDVIDIFSTQNWLYDIQNQMGNFINNNPDKIICNVEHGGYEKGIFEGFHGTYENAKMCFMRNMMCTFMGLYTVYYWQNAAWNIVIWDMESLAPEFRPKLEYYKNLRKYMEYMKFENVRLHPKFGISKMCLEDEEYLYYFKPTDMSHINLNMSEGKEIGNICEWYNPIKDEYISFPLDKKDNVCGVRSPWVDDMSILKLKKIKKDDDKIQQAIF